jgi:hypothetical protein
VLKDGAKVVGMPTKRKDKKRPISVLTTRHKKTSAIFNCQGLKKINKIKDT